ncbi:hypothetical protein J6590_018061 [Homalodisca vitripennis]|nr:hypothetical protein J6590_018061 [Homalodisca vitripennis]
MQPRVERAIYVISEQTSTTYRCYRRHGTSVNTSNDDPTLLELGECSQSETLCAYKHWVISAAVFIKLGAAGRIVTRREQGSRRPTLANCACINPQPPV